MKKQRIKNRVKKLLFIPLKNNKKYGTKTNKKINDQTGSNFKP